MKAYTYQIGEGSDVKMSKVAFSQELLADSLGEAVDKAKALSKVRPGHANEEMVHILDESREEGAIVWARSVEDIRNV